MRKGGFVTKVLHWARHNETLRIVDDQVSGPTWSRLLAETTAQVIARMGPDPFGWARERTGLYHLAGDGQASRYEWARAILELDPERDEQTVRSLLPAKSAEFPTLALRPLFSALKCDLFHDTFALRLPPWQDALKLAMER
jgi:dTDP-4-dehydrorhamnose reductase